MNNVTLFVTTLVAQFAVKTMFMGYFDNPFDPP